GTLIIPVPTILYPLIDAAAHIIQPKRIWLETADLHRLIGSRDVGAILAIRHSELKLVAPPVFCLRPAAGGIFPFGFGWKPICLSGCGREPGNIVLGIAPAYVRDRCIILAGCHERARFRQSAFVPFANGNRILTDRERPDRDLVRWLLREVVVAAHDETAAGKRLHLR